MTERLWSQLVFNAETDSFRLERKDFAEVAAKLSKPGDFASEVLKRDINLPPLDGTNYRGRVGGPGFGLRNIIYLATSDRGAHYSIEVNNLEENTSTETQKPISREWVGLQLALLLDADEWPEIPLKAFWVEGRKP